MGEIEKEAERKRADAEEAAKQAAEAKRKEITEAITRDAERDRDSAQAEADELRRAKVQQAREAAAAERARIMAEIEKEAKEKREKAEARQKELDDAIAAAQGTLAALQEKVKGLQLEAERKAQRIVEIGRRTAESIRAAAEGEHGFLVELFGNEPFVFKSGKHAGKSYLEYAREKYERKLRNERLKDMPDSVKDAGKGQQAGADGPTGPGT